MLFCLGEFPTNVNIIAPKLLKKKTSFCIIRRLEASEIISLKPDVDVIWKYVDNMKLIKYFEINISSSYMSLCSFVQ